MTEANKWRTAVRDFANELGGNWGQSLWGDECVAAEVGEKLVMILEKHNLSLDPLTKPENVNTSAECVKKTQECEHEWPEKSFDMFLQLFVPSTCLKCGKPKP